MSFVWFRPEGPLRSREQIAREVHAVSLARGLDDLATVMALMCISVESNFWCPGNDKDPCFRDNPDAYPHDSLSNDGYSSGYYQQQMSGPGVARPWGWGGLWGDPEGTRKRMDLRASTDMFLAALPGDYGRANNAASAGQVVADVQKPNPLYRGRYAEKWDEAWDLLDRALTGGPGTPSNNGGNTVGFTGDPVWLEDVLREALGDRLHVVDGWKTRGTGVGENGGDQMGPLWGVMIHHTGNRNETVERIRDGREDLPGPLSQCLITPDGICHLIAVGPCNHAGIGEYPGIPRNMGNTRLIGFECAWPTIGEDGSYNERERWPDAQIITMRDAATAVVKRLGYGSDRVIGHKEYATKVPNVKWDPGNIDMNWFRGEVAKDLRGDFDGPPIVIPPVLTDRQLLERIDASIADLNRKLDGIGATK